MALRYSASGTVLVIAVFDSYDFGGFCGSVGRDSARSLGFIRWANHHITACSVARGPRAGCRFAVGIVYCAEPKLPDKFTAIATARDKDQMQAERLRSTIPTSILGALLAGFLLDQFYRKVQELKLKDLELPK
jgi:hypothetical protein